MKNACSTFLILITLLHYLGCKHQKVEPNFLESFYYWKTVFKLTDAEKHLLDEKQIKKIFVRYFDIGIINNEIGIITPIDWQDTIQLEIVPVIFIKNNVFVNISKEYILTLVKKTLIQIENKSICEISEIQFDCDWTKTTRNNYFHFLEQVKRELKKNIKISSTLRLHQLKFSDISGIPPVESVTLMLYNIDDYDDIKTKNSIFDKKIVYDYLGDEETYPLHLNFAFPIFEQMILFRNGQFITFFRNKEIQSILEMKNYNLDDNNLIIKKDTILGTTSILKDDIIRYEPSNSKEINEVIHQIKYQNSEQRNLIWFDLNEKNFERFSK